jgi:hypothetical protein
MTSNIIVVWLVVMPRLLANMVLKSTSMKVRNQAILAHPHKGNETPISYRESKV